MSAGFGGVGRSGRRACDELNAARKDLPISVGCFITCTARAWSFASQLKRVRLASHEENVTDTTASAPLKSHTTASIRTTWPSW